MQSFIDFMFQSTRGKLTMILLIITWTFDFGVLGIYIGYRICKKDFEKKKAIGYYNS